MNNDKKMTVFISWSQKVSHEIAEILEEYLYTLFNEKIEFWVSSLDIPAGNIFVIDIIEALQRSSMGIICLDRSNYKKPWINFETGVVFGRNYRKESSQSIIFPIVFDDLQIDAFRGTPLGNMQLLRFGKTRMKNVIAEINKMYKEITGDIIHSQKNLSTLFDGIWPELSSKISSVIEQVPEKGDADMLCESNVVEKLRNYKNFPEPVFGGNVMRYGSGFETQPFYEFLLENVTSRLYVFGRKNSKMGGIELAKKFKQLMDKNVEMKILFMNPNSAFAEGRRAQNIPDFRNALIGSIKKYSEKFSSMGLNIEDYCRMYSNQRDCEYIIADHVVFYKELSFTQDQLPAHFTGASFTVAATESQLGSFYLKSFNDIWEENKDNSITKDFVATL